MDPTCCMSIANIEDLEEYKEILDSIIALAHQEVSIIKNGGKSGWSLGQLEKIVLPEMVELQQYVLRGKLFLKYGKEQRLLESTYILTDSINAISITPLGGQICKLQVKIGSQT